MLGYLFRRTWQMALTLFLILTVTFLLVQAQPGDYASFYALNPDLPPDIREQLRATFGLDRPLWQQYLIHMRNTLTGDFGVSFGHFPRPVMEVLAERLPRTLVLFVTATAASFYIGFLLGKAIAWRRGGFLEYAATITGTTLFTVFHPGIRPDDDMDLCLQAWMVSGWQIPGSAGVEKLRRNRQLGIHPDADYRRRIHRLCSLGTVRLEKV